MAVGKLYTRDEIEDILIDRRMSYLTINDVKRLLYEGVHGYKDYTYSELKKEYDTYIGEYNITIVDD